ncbi:MAG: MFS transporter [Thermodesulfobacteriota bacterium]
MPMPEQPGKTTPLDKKRVAAWALYDFANSVYPAVITTTVFSVYYVKHVVGNTDGLGDLWWGRAISASMLFVALSSPILGAAADAAGVRKKLLFFFTSLCIVSVALLTTVKEGMVLWGFALAVLANIGFEAALVYYNAYLPDVAPYEKRGFVSGMGFAAGYAGSAAGLLVALPLVAKGEFELVWLSVSIFFAIFSIPVFMYLPSDKPGTKSFVKASFGGASHIKRLIKDVMGRKDLRRFLLSYFVYIDGVNTIVYFAAIFAATTLGFDNMELIYLFLIVQVSALMGAILLAKPTDTWGPKAVITGALILWFAVAVIAAYVESKAAFFAISVAAGLGLGTVQSASRAFMSELIPKGKEAEMFGFYAFCGKSSSVAGPLVFGTMSYLSGGNQTAAILVIAAFFPIGLLLLRRVNAKRPENAA